MRGAAGPRLTLVGMWWCLVGVVEGRGVLGRRPLLEIGPKLAPRGDGFPCGCVEAFWNEVLGYVVALGINWVPSTCE